MILENTDSIYMLVCPLDGNLKYIGRTNQFLFDRLEQHMSYKPKKINIFNIRKYNWIQDLKSKGLKPKIYKVFRCNEKHVEHFEKIYCFYAKYILNIDLLNTDIVFGHDLFPYVSSYEMHLSHLNQLDCYAIKRPERLTDLNYPLKETLLSRNKPIEDYSKLPTISFKID